jgi:toxin-antitoxin system PIN domain toxin
VIAVDTNILVYSHRRDSQWFSAAYRRIRELAEGSESWGIPWPCIHEFLAIVTNPRIYNPPTSMAAALRQVELWMESPSLRLLGEIEDHLAELGKILLAAKIHGAAVHDARIAAICVEHRVDELWTLDRDFSRFPGLRTTNPLVA